MKNEYISLNRAVSLFALMVILLTACSSATISTPTSTLELSPTVVATPEIDVVPKPTAVKISGWDQSKIHVVCLKVEQDFTNGISMPVFEVAKQILSRVGLQVVSEGQECDSQMILEVHGEGLIANYSLGACASGARITGRMILTSTDQTPLMLPFRYSYPTPPVIGDCETPFDRVLSPALLDAWVHLFDLDDLLHYYKNENIKDFLAILQSSKEDLLSKGIRGNTNAYTRMYVIWIMAEEGKEVVPDLVFALGDEDSSLRDFAAESLAAFGTLASPTVIPILRDPDQAVFAALALGEMKPVTPEIILALERIVLDNNSEMPIRQAAIKALLRSGNKTDQLTFELIEQLDSEDLLTRLYSAQLLEEFEIIPNEAIPVLIGALSDEYSVVRQAAVQTLGKIGLDAQAAIPDLLNLLNDSEADIRLAAVEALIYIKPNTKDAAFRLFEVMRDNNNDRGMRWLASSAIGNMGIDAKDLIPSLIGVLERELPAGDELETDLDRMDLLEGAMNILGRMGPDAKPAIPILLQFLATDDWTFRSDVVRTLGEIGVDAQEVVPWLIQALEMEPIASHPEVIYALGNFGPDADDAVPSLIQILNNDDYIYNQSAAIYALVRIGPTREDVIQSLTQALENEDLQLEAIRALGMIGLTDTQLASLDSELNTEDWRVIDATARILFDIGPKATSATPILKNHLINLRFQDIPFVVRITRGAMAVEALKAITGEDASQEIFP